MEISGLFLGLGNPGSSYANTRHNAGFMAVDTLLDACEKTGDIIPLSGSKKKFEAWKCRIPPNSPKAEAVWIVAKPLTFMNKSGEAALALLQFYKIPLSRLVVAHDEVDLPLGGMRFKFGGGDAGHNGIRSLVECTGSRDFYRLRLGIGKPLRGDVAPFVLERFSGQEMPYLAEILPAAITGFFLFCSEGLAKAQNSINSFSLAPCPHG
ncbi:peptidyl-tRNA hydrolase [Deltaproteobacteria bacterium]|nr:peptidyl-tRNA hydrolase [Deltaproteobacteria bacterium]